MHAVARRGDEHQVVHRHPVPPRDTDPAVARRAALTSPVALHQLQRSVGNQAVGTLLARRAAAAPVQRCGEVAPDECPCHDDAEEVAASSPAPVAMQRAPVVVQREPVSALAILGWCLSGAATTLALDVIISNLSRIGWEFRRIGRAIVETAQDIPRAAPMVAGPTAALGAGGGFRGAMDRDRRRMMAIAQGRAQPPPRRATDERPPWVFNKCTALISVLVGCVFGIAGGAVRTMLVQAGKWTGRGVLELAKKAGYEQAMGKWGMIIAKMGCLDRPLDGVQPRSAAEVRPELQPLIDLTAGGESTDDGGMCYPEPEPVSSQPEEMVCRAPA